MENNKSATDILLEFDFDRINRLVNFTVSLTEDDLNIGDFVDVVNNTVDTVSNNMFSAFYNTTSYYVNYALEYMTPVLGDFCNYFRDDTSNHEIYYEAYYKKPL
ncbi:MAG TPA: hypothetical protein LFW21_00325 [Rickettsia endosymbiont of Pyrocoelia pectoralis]|nr:hypothetical protein [Rickettsia endosymbiont of Pyrocoelia pectoralis]